MNVWTGVGRVGRNAEVRYTPNGAAVMNFTLAVDVGFGDKKSTLWLDCAGFGKMAEGNLPQYVVKGAQVAVSGEINLRQFQKNNGESGASVTLRVNNLDLVGGQPQQGQQDRQQEYYERAQTKGKPVAGGSGPENDLEDIPFGPAHYIQG